MPSLLLNQKEAIHMFPFYKMNTLSLSSYVEQNYNANFKFNFVQDIEVLLLSLSLLLRNFFLMKFRQMK